MRFICYLSLTGVGILAGYGTGSVEPVYTVVAIPLYLILIGILAVLDRKEIG